MTDCSNFLATRTEQPFNMRRMPEIGLWSPDYDKHFLVLVIVLVIVLAVKSEVL